MSQLLQCLISGIAMGVTFGIVGIGFTLIYRVTNIVNLAQGTFVAAGGLLAATLMGAPHLGPIAGATLPIIVVVPMAAAMGWLTVFAKRVGGELTALVVTIGLSIIFEGAAYLVFGGVPLTFNSPVGQKALFIMGAAVLPQQILTVVIALVLLALSQWFLNHTIFGAALRASAVNGNAARSFAIDIRLMGVIAFAFSALLCSLIGSLSAPISPVTFDSDMQWTINGFSAAVLGGLRDPLRAMGGGVALGLSESFIGAYVASTYETSGALLLMLLVLLFLPQGLFTFGSKKRANV